MDLNDKCIVDDEKAGDPQQRGTGPLSDRENAIDKESVSYPKDNSDDKINDVLDCYLDELLSILKEKHDNLEKKQIAFQQYRLILWRLLQRMTLPNEKLISHYHVIDFLIESLLNKDIEIEFLKAVLILILRDYSSEKIRSDIINLCRSYQIPIDTTAYLIGNMASADPAAFKYRSEQRADKGSNLDVEP